MAFGGGDGTRTHDRLVANQVLYQLSYAPDFSGPQLKLARLLAGVQPVLEWDAR